MKNNISQDLIKGAFGKHPHDIYMAYDELTDELIIRLIEPSVLAYVHELENNSRFALLVEAESREIVGFQLFNFQRDHLQQPNWSNLRNDWEQAKSVYRATGYTRFLYDPNKSDEVNKNPMVKSANTFRLELQKSLA